MGRQRESRGGGRGRPRAWQAAAPWLVSAALVVAVAAVYAPVATHGFLVFDDPEYVTENPAVRAGLGWEGVRWAFTHWHSATWHPLTTLSHMADVSLHGMVAGRHLLGNVALHAANAVLLFAVLRAMTGASAASAAVAGLFALHPLRVESVAWVSERKDVLSAFFGLLALAAWVGWVRRGGAWRYGLVLLAFAASLLAKPMLVTLPAVLLLLDVWPLGRTGGAAGQGLLRLVVEKLPLVALAAAVSAVTLEVQARAGAVVALEALPFAARLANAIAACAAYLRLTLWPAGLSPFYPLRPDVPWVLPLGLLAAVSAAVAVLGRRRPWLVVGWLWYLGMLVPVIGLVKAGEQAMADRFTYLPLVGVAIMVVWGARELAARRPGLRPALAACAVGAILACAVAARAQVGRWRDSETLFRHAIAVTRDNHVAHFNLGADYLRRGLLDPAQAELEEAARLRPGWGRPRANLARIATLRGDRAAARALYAEAIRLSPGDPLAPFNLGLLLTEDGALDQAMVAFRQALAASPDHAKAWAGLAQAEERAGRTGEAIASYRRALASDPGLSAAHNNLALLLERAGRPEEALEHYAANAALLPDDPRARYNLAALLLDMGRPREAAEHFAAAARLMPDSPEARQGLARAQAAAAGGAR